MSAPIVAAVQMNSTGDKAGNLESACRLIEKAASRGAKLVAIPELFNALGAPELIVEQAEPPGGATSSRMSELAQKLGITLLAGSIAEREEDGSVYNSSLLFGPDGKLLSNYRKLHLFDIDLPGSVTFAESDFISPGKQIVVTDTEVGTLGQATCYDLRFPELFRELVDRGAKVIAIPSAFTMATGRDHWEILLRARAIENQVFMIAPNQFGKHNEELQTYGRSMIIDPWGTVLAKASDGEGVITAELNMAQLEKIRSRLPCLQHRRDMDSISSNES